MQHLRNLISKALCYIVCLYVLFTPSCSPRPKEPGPPGPTVELPFHADMSFTAKDRKAILGAAKEWERATNGMVSITFTWDVNHSDPTAPKRHEFHHVLLKADGDDPFVQYLDETTSSYHLAFTSPPGGIYGPGPFGVKVVLIRDRMEDSDMEKLIAIHEFGHVLGAHHIQCSGSCVMEAGYREIAPCLASRDLEEFCRANKCDRPMNPCVQP